MDITNINHLQELFGAKPISSFTPFAPKPFLTNKEFIIGCSCLIIGVAIGYYISQDSKDN